jgi:hypothetical protein
MFGAKDGNSMCPFCPILKEAELRDMPITRPCDLVLDEGVVEDMLARANGSIGLTRIIMRNKAGLIQPRIVLFVLRLSEA